MKRRAVSFFLVVFTLWTLGATFAVERADAHFALRKYENGTEHQDVLHIQNAMRQGGYMEADTLTTYYGEQTTEAVKAFQKASGLKVDGVAGAHTIEAMFEAGFMNELDTLILKPKEDSPSVDKLQKALRGLGLLEIDQTTTYYGEKTKNAVKAYQESKGLEADGVAGTLTLHELEKGGLLFLASTQGEKEDAPKAKLVGTLSKSVLKPGDKGQDVGTVQKVLALEGVLSSEDFTSYYGEKTQAGMKMFQEKYGLKADGVAGVETINKIVELGYASRPQVVSRKSGERRFGEYISWNKVMGMIDKGNTVFVLEDFYTGKTFKVLAAYGGVHSDVEPLTAEDAQIIKQLWGGSYSWVRRPMLVHFKGRIFAASLNGMPHAGREDKPEGQYIKNRSGGFGYGYNFDSVKGNRFSGHLCLHFRGSKLHSNRRSDSKHQKNVRIAAGME